MVRLQNSLGTPSNVVIGIEVTTGPLGQGFASAVGLAMAQAHYGAIYNKEGFDLIDNYTYGNVLVTFSVALSN
jgi:transketolase